MRILSSSICLCLLILLSVVAQFQLVVPQSTTLHLPNSSWQSATATWYGAPEGDGSDGNWYIRAVSVFSVCNFKKFNCSVFTSSGGACGYGSLVDVKPFRARVGAVSPVLFQGGIGCGACYKVKCLDKRVCSRRAVTVIITDECPGGYCSGGRTHFDLSGAAFGRMAVSGLGSSLRDRGVLPVIFRR